VAVWPLDEALIRQVREDVFVREQRVPLDLEWDDRDRDCTHLLAFSPAGQPVATARMTRDGRIGRMAVLQAWRRQGIGSRLLGELLVIAGKAGLEQVKATVE